MNERIQAELARIERQYEVRALLAVESGSRAWGFRHRRTAMTTCVTSMPIDPNWYLAVFEHRDVIEEMLPDKLDISSWDLRKTLRLFSKCNVALNEWLGLADRYIARCPGFNSGSSQASCPPTSIRSQPHITIAHGGASACRGSQGAQHRHQEAVLMRCVHCWRAAGLLTRSRNRRPNLADSSRRNGYRQKSVSGSNTRLRERGSCGRRRASAVVRGAHRGVAARD